MALNKKYREQDWDNVGYETATTGVKVHVKHSAVDFYDEVETLKGEQPFDKDSEAYVTWRDSFNKKMRHFNAMIGWRAFKLAY